MFVKHEPTDVHECLHLSLGKLLVVSAPLVRVHLVDLVALRDHCGDVLRPETPTVVLHNRMPRLPVVVVTLIPG